MPKPQAQMLEMLDKLQRLNSEPMTFIATKKEPLFINRNTLFVAVAIIEGKDFLIDGIRYSNRIICQSPWRLIHSANYLGPNLNRYRRESEDELKKHNPKRPLLQSTSEPRQPLWNM